MYKMSVGQTAEELGVAITAREARVLERVESEQAMLIEILTQLIRFQTPNPPGGNEAEAQRWVENELARSGLITDMWDVLPGRPNVVGVLRGTGDSPTVVLNGHIDVCEDRLLDRWSTPAYEPVVREGAVYGRGSTDMKSGLASFMFSLRALQSENVRLRGTVVLESVIGEEAGEPGTRSAIEHGYTGDLAIVGEASSGRDLVAGIGVMNFRVVIASDASLHLVARKLTLSAGGGLAGANCAEKMATRIVPAMNELERHWAVFKRHPLVPPSFASINLLKIEGGGNTFILPERSTAYFTVLYYPNDDVATIQAEVEEQIDRAAAMDPWLRTHPPSVEWQPKEFPVEFVASEFDVASPAVRTLSGAIEAVVGEPPRVDSRGAITDAGWFYRAGIPAVVYGPGDVQYVHRVDERVRVRDLVRHCQATTLFLMRFCGLSDDDEDVGGRPGV